MNITSQKMLYELTKRYPEETYLLFGCLYKNRLQIEDSTLNAVEYSALMVEINKELIQHIDRFPDKDKDYAIEFIERILTDDLVYDVASKH